MSLGKCILVAAVVSVSSVSFANQDYPLIACTTIDQNFAVSFNGVGQVTIDETQTDLVSVAIIPLEQGKITSYHLETAQGNSIVFTLPDDLNSSPQYWDRGALGGQCSTFLVNKAGLKTLAARSLEISKAQWRLAECAYGADKFVVNYHAGFAPNTVIVQGKSENIYVDAVINNTSFAGGLSGSLTDLMGEGSFHYFAAGHHVKPVTKLSVIKFKKQIPQLAGVFRTGFTQFDQALSDCAISNDWHIRSLVNGQ